MFTTSRFVRFFALVVCITTLKSAQSANGQPLVTTPKPGVLRVAHDEKYPPFEFQTGRRSDGFDLAVIEKAAQRLGLRVEFYPMPWEQVHEALLAGRADVT